ncbi:putative short-chain dehydrogenase [Aspergillus ellipticus CBS 707.79]|uniref:Putative short-chain dehydrogenase n=1 Tax=Aspergillus ellipticus CBS 707.79 TaxID=1448320 RepID=A0A319DDV5_9EURO|nr:putative short-chain dehydrogenase [Aspergillus ellipticus CBS 707.79]
MLRRSHIRLRLPLFLHRTLTSTPTQPLPDGDLHPLKPRIPLTNKTFVVTGGARGIGYSIARAISELGGNVSVWDIAPSPVEDYHTLADEFGVKTMYIPTDVSDEGSLRNALDQTMGTFGKLDGCVTAAGTYLVQPFLEHTGEDLSRMLKVNTLGTFLTTQLVVSQLRAQNTPGSIVMIASIAAQTIIPGMYFSAYNASKAGVWMLGRALAYELGPHGIRVNTVSPGFTDTVMMAPLKQDPETLKKVESIPPLKRIGKRSDVAPAVTYLLGDGASYVTGVDLVVDGGLQHA